MKRNLPILQIFFKVFLIFLITFVWVRYFVKSLAYSILISAFLTMIIDFLTRYFSNKKQKRISLKKDEIKNAENMFLSLATSNNGFSFLKNTFSQKHNLISKKKYFIYEDKTLLYPYFSLSPVTPNEIIDIMSVVSKEKINKIVIVSGEFSSDCQKIISLYDKQIILLNQYETYEKIYKSYQSFPAISNKIAQTKKTSIKDLLSYSFNRSRTKGYVFSAIIIFICSLFVKASLYYAIITSTLLIFAIISFSNPFFNKKTPQEDFWLLYGLFKRLLQKCYINSMCLIPFLFERR